MYGAFEYSMEGDTTDLLRQHKKALDRGVKDVMPDKWVGHGRYHIRDSERLTDAQEQKALKVLESLNESKPEQFETYGAERVANKVIEKLV
jgi:hypothetical protein